MSEEFDVILPGVILLSVRATHKSYAIVHVRFVRQKTEQDPAYYKDIDRKLAEGKNHIINLGESVAIPGIQIKLKGVVERKEKSLGSTEEKIAATTEGESHEKP